MTTPADEIRAAARKLREIARDATPSPWCATWIQEVVRHIARNCDIACRDHEYDCAGWDRYTDGPYIALMHPAVGFAVADWLDSCADQAKDMRSPTDYDTCDEPSSVKRALAVARAVNGGDPT